MVLLYSGKVLVIRLSFGDVLVCVLVSLLSLAIRFGHHTLRPGSLSIHPNLDVTQWAVF
jgi:hypothetical protein